MADHERRRGGWLATGLDVERCCELADFGVLAAEAHRVHAGTDVTAHARDYVRAGLTDRQAADLALLDEPPSDDWRTTRCAPGRAASYAWFGIAADEFDAVAHVDPIRLRMAPPSLEPMSVGRLLVAGVPSERLHEWESVVDAGLDPEPWARAGVAAATAIAWCSAGVEPRRVASWAEAGFGPDDHEWFAAFEHASTAGRWVVTGFAPSDAARLGAAGVDPAAAEGWSGVSSDPDEIIRWDRVDADPELARRWSPTDWPPADAVVLDRAGMAPDESRPWRARGWEATEIIEWWPDVPHPDDASELRDLDLDEDPRAWFRAIGDTGRIAHLAGLGLDLDQATRWAGTILTDGQIAAAVGCGLDPDDAVAWRAAGVRFDAIEAWRRQAIDTPVDVGEWTRRGLGVDDVVRWRAVGVRSAAVAGRLEPLVTSRWTRAVLAELGEHARAWIDGFPEPSIAVEYARVCDRPAEAAEWWLGDIAPSAVPHWRTRRATPEQAARLRAAGIGVGDARAMAPVEIVRWLDAGVSAADVNRWHEHGDLGSAKRWIASRLPGDLALEWAALVRDPGTASKAHAAGLTPADVASWSVRPSDDVEFALAYWEHGLDMRRSEPHWYGRYAARGLTAEGAALARAEGGLDGAVGAERAFRPVDLPCELCGEESRRRGSNLYVNALRRRVRVCEDCQEERDVRDLELDVWNTLSIGRPHGWWRG